MTVVWPATGTPSRRSARRTVGAAAGPPNCAAPVGSGQASPPPDEQRADEQCERRIQRRHGRAEVVDREHGHAARCPRAPRAPSTAPACRSPAPRAAGRHLRQRAAWSMPSARSRSVAEALCSSPTVASIFSAAPPSTAAAEPADSDRPDPAAREPLQAGTQLATSEDASSASFWSPGFRLASNSSRIVAALCCASSTSRLSPRAPPARRRCPPPACRRALQVVADALRRPMWRSSGLSRCRRRAFASRAHCHAAPSAACDVPVFVARPPVRAIGLPARCRPPLPAAVPAHCQRVHMLKGRSPARSPRAPRQVVTACLTRPDKRPRPHLASRAHRAHLVARAPLSARTRPRATGRPRQRGVQRRAPRPSGPPGRPWCARARTGRRCGRVRLRTRRRNGQATRPCSAPPRRAVSANTSFTWYDTVSAPLSVILGAMALFFSFA